MTGPRDREPVPELTTTRVGGSSRACVTALVAAVVLVGVVYVGLSGRTDSGPLTASVPQPSPVALRPTPTRRPERTPGPITTIEQIRDPDARPQYQYLGTALILGGQEFIAALDQQTPTYFYGLYGIPLGWTADSGTLELAQMTSSVSHDTMDRLGQWDLSLEAVVSTPMGNLVLDAVQPPAPSTVGTSAASTIALHGYRITARLEHQSDFDLLAIEVHVGSDPLLPSEDY